MTPRSMPTKMEPRASGMGEPVTWCNRTPTNAMTRPISAAASSANTARVVGSDVLSAWVMTSRFTADASFRELFVRLPERDAFEDERDAEDGVGDTEVGGRFGMEQFLDAVGDRDTRAECKQSEGGEHRPDVCLPAVPEWLVSVGNPFRAAVRDQQQHFVAGIGPGVGGLCDHRCRSGDDGGRRLGTGDQRVRRKRQYDRRGALVGRCFRFGAHDSQARRVATVSCGDARRRSAAVCRRRRGTASGPALRRESARTRPASRIRWVR